MSTHPRGTPPTIWEASRELPVVADVDVLVCGGGVAGIAAAVCAARTGAKTLLVERNGALGGTASVSLMSLITIPYSGLHAFPREFFGRLAELGGASNEEVVAYNPELFKYLAQEMVIEAGAQLLLYTAITDVILEGRDLKGIIVENKSGRQVILAKATIDVTGDADIAARTGAPCVLGRDRDHKMRPATVLFRLGGVDINEIKSYVEAHPEELSPDASRRIVDPKRGILYLDGFFSLVEAARQRGDIPQEIHYLRLFGWGLSEVSVNSGRVYGVNGTDAFDVTRADIEGRRQMMQILHFMQREVPGFRAAHLIDSSAMIGIRETRRIIGEYVLTEKDMIEQRQFPDTVARAYTQSFAGVEIHGPDGGEGSTSDNWSRKSIPQYTRFNIPYRSLLPKDVDNLLVAGRCLSVTHEGDKWTRAQGKCMHMGQAAGVAAALSARAGVTPRRLDIKVLQEELIAQRVDIGAPSPEGV